MLYQHMTDKQPSHRDEHFSVRTRLLPVRRVCHTVHMDANTIGRAV